MKIVLVTGRRGSGKTEMLKYLQNKFITVEMSKYVYAEMDKAGIQDKSSTNVGIFSKQLRERFGNDIVAKLVWDDIKDYEGIIFIFGVRSPEEIEFFKKKAKVLVVKIDSSDENRFKRILARNREGDPVTYEEFLKKEQLEDLLGLNQIKEDIIISNDKDIKEFYSKIDNLINFLK